jgi:hypothetical protein
LATEKEIERLKKVFPYKSSVIPLETELRFKEGLSKALLSGVKRITIREGTRRFSSNIIIHGRQAKTHWYKHTTLLHTDFTVLQGHGYKTMFEALIRLKEHYPKIDLNSPITIVEFRLIVP